MLLILFTILPTALIIGYIYSKDKYEKEPAKTLIYAFLLGVVSVLSVFPVTEAFEFVTGSFTYSRFQLLLYVFIIIALVEELVKFYFLRFVMYKHKDFNEPIDGIVYGVLIGMGFATLENIFYVMEGGMSVAIARMFTAVPAHATFGIVMGYFVGKAKFNEESAIKESLLGLFAATFMHGVYDYLLMQEIYSLLAVGAFVGLYISIYYVRRLIKEQQEQSPFKRREG
ncbi:MAG: PrsW family intramembrane metalloprotease [Chitinophagales bacterium]|nr:PrsW family glutamic-type intramembrane protease [Chitinophagales bacterium]MCZ2394131.1 PrsW family intramembrane metalloprotease [Chitinophagales bacterium]